MVNCHESWSSFNARSKEIIEIFGEYWHGPEKVRSERATEEGRIEAFARFGYRTLVIWVNEVADLNGLEKKVKEFVATRQ